MLFARPLPDPDPLRVAGSEWPHRRDGAHPGRKCRAITRLSVRDASVRAAAHAIREVSILPWRRSPDTA